MDIKEGRCRGKASVNAVNVCRQVAMIGALSPGPCEAVECIGRYSALFGSSDLLATPSISFLELGQ